MIFANVSCKHPNIVKPLHYGWMIKIRNEEDLFEFAAEKDWLPKKVFLDMMTVLREEALRGVKQHPTHPLTAYLNSITEEHEGVGFVQHLARINCNKIEAMAKNLPVYINSNGGWMPSSLDCVENKVVESAYQIFRWLEGKHYYVKVGNMDVEVDGRCKWNSQEEAKAAYEKWLTRQS
jgi:hypothetical protein